MAIHLAILLLLLGTHLVLLGAVVNSTSGSNHHHPPHTNQMSGAVTTSRKLFVFGDSYADTGNLAKVISPSWSEPYGITFPRHPAGRFSDGRVLTDYVASSLGIKSPVPYRFRNFGRNLLPFGMNFAIGGSGIFDNGILHDNVTVQIDALNEQIDEGVFSKLDLEISIAVVSISGNDYVNYQDNGGTMEGLKMFTPKLIYQLKLELKRLRDMGIPRIAVTNLHPIGCTPYITNPSSNTACNDSVNLAVSFHNDMLNEMVQELNSSSNVSSIVIIDLFNAFTSVLNRQGGSKFVDVLKPCCHAISTEYRCGYVDLNGEKKYTVCGQPDSKFYWDSVHPTQAGWYAIFKSLRPSLSIMLNRTHVVM